MELGFFKAEGLDAEFVPLQVDVAGAFRKGEVDLIGASPYSALSGFPEWKGAKLLCALSHYFYWFLAVRADLGARRGDVNAVRGLRISAQGRPGLFLKRVLEEAGLDLERDRIQLVTAPRPEGSWASLGAQSIEQGLADGFWGNAMRVEYAVRRGLATLLLDLRWGDGPPASRHFTFPALITTDRLIEERPEAAVGAVRAIVKTQQALKADPALATQVGRRLFPAEEAEVIAGLIARDAEFYVPTISEAAISATRKFARDIGLLAGPVAYKDVVATQFAGLWDSV